MTSIGSPSPFFLAGKKAYAVNQSLRFNDDDSAYLARTPSSASNRKTWTLSFWFKRGTLGIAQNIFCTTGSDNSTFFDARIQTNDTITLGLYTSYLLQTNQVFRDPSAWYHMVVVLDSTQATASNRLKWYINGNQITSFSTDNISSLITQDGDFGVNSTAEMTFGKHNLDNNKFFDGYIAEINHVDGSAYDPSYFGETDAITGQWNPKKYVGSYGTNGFYLNFSDNSGTTATTLGKDSSGNGNNFTPNNFSVAAGVGNDSVTDTPSNNFATLNPLSLIGAGGTFSNGNLDFTADSNYATRTGNISLKTGKWYWEVIVTSLGGVDGDAHGIVQGSHPNGNIYPGYDPNGNVKGIGWYNGAGGLLYGSVPDGGTNGGTISAGDSALSAYTTNDVLGFASDIANGTLAFYKNGTLEYTLTGIGSHDWFPAVCGYGTSSTKTINFGQLKATSTTYADANGHGSFKYSVPSGFLAMCTANLPDPTIKQPNKHFDTLLYTGTGSTQSITGLNFQPDWVWLKSRSQSHNHGVIDSVRGRAAIMFPNSSSAEMTSTATQDLVSFDAPTSGNNGGITVGTVNNLSASNDNGTTIVAWNWNAGDTDGKTYTVTVVSDSGNKYRFDGYGTSAVTLDLAEGGTYIFNYPSTHPFRFSTTSDGTHGGGSEYTTGVTVISSTSVQIVVAASAPTLYYYCTQHSGMGGAINTNTTLGSSNFDGGIQSIVKANTTSGFSIVTYTGNGSAGASVGHGLGVIPRIVIVKRRNSGDDWRINIGPILGSGKEGHSVKWNSTGGEADTNSLFNSTNPTSSVFTIGNDADVNSNGSTYLAYCFSDVASYSKFDKYIGNGNADGTFVFTGFRPAWLLMKNVSTGSTNFILKTAKIQTRNVMEAALQSNRPDAESSSLSSVDFLSNGFKIRNTGSFTNTSGNTYIYWCFAESPFKNARAR